jgi:hypothetical protein
MAAVDHESEGLKTAAQQFPTLKKKLRDAVSQRRTDGLGRPSACNGYRLVFILHAPRNAIHSDQSSWKK